MLRSLRHCAALLCAALFLQGCATSSSISSARSQFYSGQTKAALNTLNSADVSRRDLLLANLDKGLIAHTSGDYQQSVDAFLAAVALLEEMDYLSVREQTATLVTNDWAAAYKGEYSERLWVHTFQMMNFLMLNDASAAAVEARQALKLLDKHNNSLKNDWYTRALIAMSFEAAEKPDSAHIEYKKLLADMSYGQSGIARRAWANARRLGRDNDAKLFASFVETSASVGNDNGELILFIQTGAIPRKTSSEVFVDENLYASFPAYPMSYRSFVTVKHIDLNNDDLSENNLSDDDQTTEKQDDDKEALVDNIHIQLVDLSRKSLEARATGITVKQALRLAAKKNLADAIYDENKALGALATVFFYASEQADTRSWETLPAQLTMVQIPLEPGTHSLDLQILVNNQPYDIKLDNITIEPRQISYRSMRLGRGSSRDELMASTTSEENPTSQLAAQQ